MEPLKKVTDLIYRHLTNDLSPEERIQLDNWIQQSDENRLFFNEVGDALEMVKAVNERNKELAVIDYDRVWNKVNAIRQAETTGVQQEKSPIIKLRWWKIGIAASVLLIIATGTYLLLKPGKVPQEVIVTPTPLQNDAKPHTNVSLLTLADGTTIILDSVKNGILATQGNSKVVKQDNGVIIYTDNDAINQSSAAYNTVSVPKGGDVVSLMLSDGSGVWLNAASSIRYPVSFAANERSIEITGEAYFEVAPSRLLPLREALGRNDEGGGEKKRPFVVRKGTTSIVVLGTKFNVNTYENEESIKVTLLEGSVAVSRESGVGSRVSKIIKPGEQAVVDESIRISRHVDIEQVMAWKNGQFVFDNTNIQMIMRQIERWYDLEVVYQGDNLQSLEFDGEISRYTNASKVLGLLEETGDVRFKIEGKKVILSRQ